MIWSVSMLSLVTKHLPLMTRGPPWRSTLATTLTQFLLEARHVMVLADAARSALQPLPTMLIKDGYNMKCAHSGDVSRERYSLSSHPASWRWLPWIWPRSEGLAVPRRRLPGVRAVLGMEMTTSVAAGPPT